MPPYPRADAATATQSGAALTREALAAARQSMVDAVGVEVGDIAPAAVERDVDADGVPCRLYHPGGALAPVVVYLHGGGWVMGGFETHHGICRRLAALSGCAVLAVDYRLAPEHPHPAALEDAERAVRWLYDGGAATLDVSTQRVAIAGDSAGGHLATVVARRARDHGRPYACQALVYPVIDPDMNYPDAGDDDLGADEMRFYWDAYVPGERTGPDVSPLRADLAGLPPTLIVTAGNDVLRDEAERYAARLTAAGVPTIAVRYLGVGHGFFRKIAKFDAAEPALHQVATTLRTALSGR
ncbi:alpha/beta hydrolase [Krasilnikovia sp. MM14-A1004]|uniref:alpha/beta hydrolase n=1 Tax=Krasilnikovia sp. MM14-A1004 TaxID=3373541 RepID=UPI00399CE10B